MCIRDSSCTVKGLETKDAKALALLRLITYLGMYFCVLTEEASLSCILIAFLQIDIQILSTLL